MKKLVAGLLTGAVALGLSGCGRTRVIVEPTPILTAPVLTPVIAMPELPEGQNWQVWQGEEIFDLWAEGSTPPQEIVTAVNTLDAGGKIPIKIGDGAVFYTVLVGANGARFLAAQDEEIALDFDGDGIIDFTGFSDVNGDGIIQNSEIDWDAYFAQVDQWYEDWQHTDTSNVEINDEPFYFEFPADSLYNRLTETQRTDYHNVANTFICDLNFTARNESGEIAQGRVDRLAEVIERGSRAERAKTANPLEDAIFNFFGGTGSMTSRNSCELLSSNFENSDAGTVTVGGRVKVDAGLFFPHGAQMFVNGEYKHAFSVTLNAQGKVVDFTYNPKISS